ncbi:MAG: hypothetical protein ACO4CT_10375 [Planctomycetota bacterium]
MTAEFLRRAKSLAAAAVLAVVPASCIPSNVVARTDREVDLEPAAVVWRPATSADLPGYFRSTDRSGALATGLWLVEYQFRADGTFTGAALLQGEPDAFAVLTGSWDMPGPGTLVLDGAEPAEIEAAHGLLRISGPDGSVVLRREDLR